MKLWFWLGAIAMSLPTAAIIPERAIAAPQACMDAETLRMAKGRSPYMLFDPDNPTNGRVNVREKPSSRAKLLREAQSRNPIGIFEQVIGDNGFCWLRVKVIYGTSSQGSALSVTGWVRGDLVKLGID